MTGCENLDCWAPSCLNPEGSLGTIGADPNLVFAFSGIGAGTLNPVAGEGAVGFNCCLKCCVGVPDGGGPSSGTRRFWGSGALLGVVVSLNFGTGGLGFLVVGFFVSTADPSQHGVVWIGT